MSDESDDSDNFDPQEFAIVKPSSDVKLESHPNNQVGLMTKLKEFTLPNDMHWIETLQVTSTNALELDNVHDDLVREAEL